MANKNVFTGLLNAVPLVGDALGAIFQGGQNRKSRQFSREMYNRQWQDQTSFSREMYEKQKQDALDFWNTQNQYNAPEAEMARLKEAGLNPALMYGQGAQANRAGSIDRPSPMSAKASALSAQFRAPTFDLSGAVRFNKELELLEAQKIATLAGARRSSADAEGTEFATSLEKLLMDSTMRMRNSEMLKSEADAEMSMMTRNVQREVMRRHIPLKKAILSVAYDKLKNAKVRADINAVKAGIRRIQNDATLKGIDIKLRQQGINPNDPAWLRMIGTYMEGIFKELKRGPGGLGDVLRKY